MRPDRIVGHHWCGGAVFFGTYRAHGYQQLHAVILVIGLHDKLLLNGECGRFAQAPVAGRILFAQLHQAGEPFLRRIDQLEAALLHHQVAAAVMQFGGRCPKEFIAARQ